MKLTEIEISESMIMHHDLDSLRNYRMLESVRKKEPIKMLHVVNKLCIADMSVQGLNLLLAGTPLGHKPTISKIMQNNSDINDIFRKRMKVDVV